MSSAAVGNVGSGRGQDNPFSEWSMLDDHMGNHSASRKRTRKQCVMSEVLLSELLEDNAHHKKTLECDRRPMDPFVRSELPGFRSRSFPTLLPSCFPPFPFAFFPPFPFLYSPFPPFPFLLASLLALITLTSLPPFP